MKFISLCLVILSACLNNPKLPTSLAGTYEVTVDLKEKSKKAIQSAKDSVKLALQSAREELSKAKVDMDVNVNNIDTSTAEGKIEYVAKSLVKQLSDSLSPNMGTLADGISELVAGTSNLGINLMETVMRLVSIDVTLKEDGSITTNQELIKAQFDTEMNWKQHNETFNLLDSKGEVQQSFTIQNRTESGFDLTNEEISLHFRNKNK